MECTCAGECIAVDFSKFPSIVINDAHSSNDFLLSVISDLLHSCNL